MNANGIDFPLRLDRSGDAALTLTFAAAAEQLIEELLFTGLGERLNRPNLGCGLLELVFDPASEELRAATQFQVASELQRWLSDIVRVTSVTTSSRGGELVVTVVYALVSDGTLRTVVFTQ